MFILSLCSRSVGEEKKKIVALFGVMKLVVVFVSDGETVSVAVLL